MEPERPGLVYCCCSQFSCKFHQFCEADLFFFFFLNELFVCKNVPHVWVILLNKKKQKKNTTEGLFDERPKQVWDCHISFCSHFHLENQPPFTAQLFGVLCCLPCGTSLRTRLLHSSNWHTYCKKGHLVTVWSPTASLQL